MYDYSEITVVIFILLLIPPMIIGYLRGWIASLSISLILFTLVGFSVLTAVKTYDNFIWPTFKGLFISGKVHHSLNPEDFKELSKSSAIVVWVGITLIPIYFLTIGLYFAFKALLVKHLWPKTKKVNTYQRKISRSKHLTSRLTGLGISTVSGFFTASLAANSLGVLINPVDGYMSFMNTFTSPIANIYTFGQSSYRTSFQKVRDFTIAYLPNNAFGDKRADALESLVYIHNHWNKNLTDLAYLKKNTTYASRIREISNDPDAFGELTRIMVRRSQKLVVLVGRKSDNTDFDWRTENYSTLVANIDAAFPNTARINLGFSEAAKAAAIQKSVEGSVQPYSQSIYMKEYEAQWKVLMEARSIRDRRKSESATAKFTKANLEAEITRDIPIRDDLKQQLDDLGDDTTLGTKIYAANEKLRLSRQAYINYQNGDWKTAQDEVYAAEQKLKDLQSKTLQAENDYVVQQNNLSVLNSDKTNLESQLEDIKKKLASAESELASIKQQITTAAPEDLANLNAKKSELEQQVSDQTTLKTKKQSEIDDKNIEIKSASTTLNNLLIAKNDANKKYNDFYTIDYPAKKTAFENANSTLMSLKIPYDRDSQEYESLIILRRSVDSKYQYLKNKIESNVQQVTKLEASIKILDDPDPTVIGSIAEAVEKAKTEEQNFNTKKDKMIERKRVYNEALEKYKEVLYKMLSL